MKTIWKLFRETISGQSDTSSKRITAFWFVVPLISSLHAAVIYRYLYYGEKHYMYSFLVADLLFVAAVFGLVAVDRILQTIETIRGKK